MVCADLFVVLKTLTTRMSYKKLLLSHLEPYGYTVTKGKNSLQNDVVYHRRSAQD